MNRYQILLLVILLAWPVVIFGILYGMSKLEDWVSRVDAESPEEAGLEPVAGSAPEKEVQIVFGDEVVGTPENRVAGGSPAEDVDGSANKKTVRSPGDKVVRSSHGD
jgi:hypothetical protein